MRVAHAEPRRRARVCRGLHGARVARATRERTPEWSWLGDDVSVADIAIFAQLHSLRTPLTAWQAARIAERPSLTKYLDRVDAATRETVNRTAMVTPGREPKRGAEVGAAIASA